MSLSIVYTTVHFNRLNELKKNIEYHLPYVDRVVVSDGGSTDGSLDWLKELSSKDSRIDFIVKKQYRLPYGNHTPDARNPYLSKVNPGDFMLCLDTDEFLEEEACKKLRHFIERADQAGFDEIRFQARDIWTYETGEVYDNLADYWKQDMLTKATANMTYTGHTHSGLYRPGALNRFAKAQGSEGRFLHYRHEKTEKSMWRNSTFLYWTTCGVAQNRTDNADWIEFHKIMSGHGYEDWHVFNKAMEAGNLPQDMKDWFIQHKNDENPEAAAYFIYYFIWLHQEENIEKLGSDKYNRYTWDYVKK